MSDTFLQKRGVRIRMQCRGQVAGIITDTFVSAEQLVDAVESDEPLTEYDGIGPKTAEKIEEWWGNRFEREEKMDDSTFERTGARTASLHRHNSWADALEGTDE